MSMSNIKIQCNLRHQLTDNMMILKFKLKYIKIIKSTFHANDNNL